MKKTNRQIVLDTETTGLNPKEGHRIIEIGCVELVNRRLTQNHFHVYINPEREIDQEAIDVHGITNDFLREKPKFAEITDDFFNFVAGAELVIHNAPFDVGFLNHELSLIKDEQRRIETQCTVFDTLVYARKKHPGARNTLDALCKRYGIDNSHRELHGALLDAEILADVYLLMTGGQASLLEEDNLSDAMHVEEIIRLPAGRKPLKVIQCNAAERDSHLNYLEGLSNVGGAKICWE
ncbi:DNA polymerase III subunit epsilon [methane-oxidizing endosymbiont of Gigantopelta aegis]|uniref:DNA polymerase III subunit epsilon n=1 Tax=methane-oxidizing endosymbiont of Gigantopelta aegis TaxID=2794938 RepID=UPI0018DC10C9|nr:DNA polymerase III subunit epsilon [methane-oxidizing endosymbiont of Gigantopelta aegis]